jgi:4-carboxymuconolactone decarboxylase
MNPAPNPADGMPVRREVLGDEHVDRARDTASMFSGPWQDHITATAWGMVWAREGLDRRTRSMLTVALLAALQHENELALHIRAAVRNGVTADELREVLLHTSVYAGVPAVNTAFGIAQHVLAELGVTEALTPYAPDLPDAVLPDADLPDADLPDADLPDADPPAPGTGP